MPPKRIKIILGTFFLLSALLVGCTSSPLKQRETPSTPTAEVAERERETKPTEEKPLETPHEEPALYSVTRIIDGDTIEVEINGQKYKVRYIGVDTPEMNPIECFGEKATARNQELVGGQRVRLEKDVSETDQYGRLLRYVFLEDGTFVNETLVRTGYAHAITYPPDVKYQKKFLEAEREARSNNRGLWSDCQGQKATVAPAVNQGQCLIKGNISSSGERIYHLPGCPNYAETVINVAKGERWFCTEKEATEAGWRKAKNCP